jgi:hypothetical protein
MESTTTARSGVDLTASKTYPVLSLILAVISIPGSTLSWDLFDAGGFVLGFPPAIAAVVLGVRHLQGPATDDRGKAKAAVAIGAAMLVMMVVWTVAESV